MKNSFSMLSPDQVMIPDELKFMINAHSRKGFPFLKVWLKENKHHYLKDIQCPTGYQVTDVEAKGERTIMWKVERI